MSDGSFLDGGTRSGEERNLMLVVVSIHLIEFTFVWIVSLARRENDSQVGDRVVTATLRCSINGRWLCAHII